MGRSVRVRAGIGVCAVAALVCLASAALVGGAASAPSAAALVRGSHGRGTIVDAPTATHASACGQNPALVCTTVDVPLDRTGVVPGTVALHVEELPAQGTPKGAMFLIAGGPGQGSAHTFGLGTPGADALFQYLFPGYTLVAYDDRGTGDSGLIDCPALQTALTEEQNRTAATACGQKLGPAAPFYGTADHAADMDAVRQALGFSQIALYGVSYGTKLAQAYALAYPQNVSRIILDSVLPVNQDESYETSALQNMPVTLPHYCAAGGCNGKTLTSDVVAVANRLAAKPLTGKVLLPSGRSTSKRVDGLEVLSVVLNADLTPGLAAELPGVMHAARLGNTQPLLRLAYLNDVENAESAIDLSDGLYAATVCRDGPFPWAPDTAPADRPALLQTAITAAPAGTFGPFGSWASQFGNADFCTGWPGPEGGVTFGTTFPNVPMLGVTGGLDLRTPEAGAAAVTAQFPQGHLLVVPSVGHSTVTADPSGCAVNAVRSWILGGPVPSSCPAEKPFVLPVASMPAPGVAKPKKPQSAAATFAIAKAALQDAESMWLLTAAESGTPARVAGLYGGRIDASVSSFTLVNYTITRGVTVSGTVKLVKPGPPVTFSGTLTVSGPAAAHGLLGISGKTLRGTLGGRSVG